MKTFSKRLTALALVLALTVGALGQTALASWALGTELVDRTVELAEGVSWTAQSLWSASKSDLRTENYITYIPGGGVTPMVYSGTYVASRNTAAAAAAALEAQGCRVIAGVNGGFFNSDGTIVGMLMTDGVVRSLDLYNWALLGFTWDGQVFIDESQITKTVSWETEDASVLYRLAGFNACRSSDDLGGLYLYNRDFSSKVNYDTGRGCVAVVLTPVSDGGETGEDVQPPEASGGEIGGDVPPPEASGGEIGEAPETSEANRGLTMNGTLTLSVEAVMDTKAGDAFNGVLADGRYMLYANYYDGNDALLNALRSLTPGQQVAVTVSGVSERWADAAYGISGLYTLLRDGEVVSGLPATANPCTAVGLREDGAAVFYTIDGRQSGYSVGAAYAQVAQRLQELGCVTAVALDGGGSTTLGATLPGEQKFGLLNQPSQSSRALNNFIFLVAGDGYAGMDPGFYLSSDTQVVLAGASLNVYAVQYDRWGKEISGTPPEEPDATPGELEMIPDWSATGGTVEGDGLTAVYTAGDAVGTYAVSAGSGSELPVRVVDALSSLWVTLEDSSASVSSLSLRPGDTVDLAAAGAWWNLQAAVNGSAVAWEADPAVGTIDASGHFRAVDGYQDVSGVITVSAGGKTVTVSVTVETDCPFTDIADHWSADYVSWLYELGLTQGIEQPDGTYTYNPAGNLSRGELLAFITRLLHVDMDEYQDVGLPFADADAVPEWMLPYVKAMYALSVLNGSDSDGTLYANVSSAVSREEAMTMLGRVLADRMSWDLSGFDDSDSVSDWALSYVETLVGLNVVQGSDGKLTPKSDITRGEAAKLLVEIDGLEKAELTPRPLEPDDTADDPELPASPDDPGQPGEDTGDPEPPAGPGDLEQPGEDTGDPEPSTGPDDPERPGEDTGDPGLPAGPSDPERPGEDAGDPDSPDGLFLDTLD